MSTYYFSIDVLDVEDSPDIVASRQDTVAPVCTLIFIATGIVITALSFLVCKVKKQRRTQRGSQGENFIYVVFNSPSSS